ncbi:tripartite tricarboxylate transporter substrate binding protein [Aquincola sp. S2]|uniref:Tripartite tricarboxylate transporter substrate binding protein n=1 Tax=Pseudaquabacterium terrae TaxID=2732868 RepID=A0ABX2EF91_9BURK|nr:tripartite tricarboxylate transporter substrate binding protein [Aquabacterium terrae]NRF67295.1 tripartite tricarboxylate transporter substrate binding protein [Aquabacterium terrae]
MKLLRWLSVATACGWAASAGASPAAVFPERGQTLRLVVPFAAGGGVDNAARLLGEQLRKQLGVTVLVENRAGASGTIGGKAVQTAAADGTTLLFSAATHVLARQVLTNPPYDPQTDFAPVARFGEAPLMVVVAPQTAQRKLADVLAAARQQPESWTAAIPAAGAPSHLATLLLAQQGGVKFTYVAYKGTQPALTDVGGGHVNLLVDSMISVLPLAKAGRVRPLAITAKKRSPLAPDVPTVHEAGLANFAYASWYGVWAPKNTPADRIAALNAAINGAVAALAKSGALEALGIEPVSETPEQFKRFIASDVSQGAELLKTAGFKPE